MKLARRKTQEKAEVRKKRSVGGRGEGKRTGERRRIESNGIEMKKSKQE